MKEGSQEGSTLGRLHKPRGNFRKGASGQTQPLLGEADAQEVPGLYGSGGTGGPGQPLVFSISQFNFQEL